MIKIRSQKVSVSRKINLSILLDKMRMWGIFLTISFTTVNTFFASISNMLGINAHSTTVTIAIIIYGMTVLSGLNSIKKIRNNNWIVLCLFLFAYFLSFTVYPNNSNYLTSMEVIRYFWIEGIPVFLCASATNFTENEYVIFDKFCKMMIIFQAFVAVASNLRMAWVDRSNYMEISYQLLLPTSYFLIKKTENWIEILMIVIGIFIIIFDGGRGAVLGLGLVLIYLIIRNMEQKKNILFSIANILLIVICCFNIDSIVIFLLNFANQQGLYGHFIRTLRSDTVTVSLSRNRIYETAIRLILSNPILGYGMGGERYYMAGSYTHQFFLEILIDYGLILGLLILCILFIMAFKISKVKDSKVKEVLYSLFFSMGFIKLLLSSSYFIEPSFFALIGLSVNYLSKRESSIKNLY